ncbi:MULTISPECIES: hypothetical protein [Methanobacterium]|jgi:hypothetical protein|uniref:Uncharacterized protein n=1 Tax=Methanobacterium veterum TaxID=408577 RepID=A0A9E5A548_9EURY|nr:MULTISPECIES: hypothetical protein [Methanobacterium]MCZ3367182.1 hypothetical protein [Methanobacterium veterum]MCZ3373670.1 hypothetical protein [Methanobacterium veterum]
MLEYVKTIKEDPYKLGFVDENSPKEWEPIINHKLLEYKESAYVDSIIKIDNIVVILELNPQDGDLNNPEYIKEERKLFENYYKRILEDIASSEFYDLYIK